MANECVDDGRGDSPRLRPIDSPPRPSHETLDLEGNNMPNNVAEIIEHNFDIKLNAVSIDSLEKILPDEDDWDFYWGFYRSLDSL